MVEKIESWNGLEARIIDNLVAEKTPISEEEIGQLQKFMDDVLKASNNRTYSQKILESLPYALRQDRMAHTYAVLLYETDPDSDSKKIGGCGFLNDWKPGGFEGGRWEVRCMYIHPDHQKKGMGKRILKQLEDVARAKELKQIELEAVNLPGTVKFYERNGWKIVKEYQKQIGECPVPLTHMSKEL